MTLPRKTADAARLLGVPYYRLWYLIRVGQIPPPPKDSGGDYWWGEQDIEAVRKILAKRKKAAAK
jgi:DNA-binding transcriptional MerR regulator